MKNFIGRTLKREETQYTINIWKSMIRICLVVILCLLIVQCETHQLDDERSIPNRLIGNYYKLPNTEDKYEYFELQFTQENYMLYYHVLEAQGRPSVYKLTSDSTFKRWWIAGETDYKYYKSGDTLFIQSLDNRYGINYESFVKINPDITLKQSFENETLLDMYYEQAWSRVELYTP